MTFVLQGEVRIAGDTARAEIDKVKASQDSLKTSTKAMSAEGRKAAAETRKLGSSAAGAAGSVDTLADQERRAAIEARTLGQTHQLAAGQVGNLTAQFNDIGVMLAAGQNPLQLAIQQGTQITQVIGPLGAAGAARALGSAFLSLVSPINIVTLAAIAGGAALVQWLTDAEEEAASLEDSLGRLKEASDRLAATDGLAAAPLSAIQEYQNLITLINEVDRLERKRAAEAVVRSTGLVEAISKNLAANNVAAQLGLEEIEFEFFGLDQVSEANLLLERTRELMAATGDEQARVLDATVEELTLRGILTEEVQAYLSTISNELGITERIIEREQERAAMAGELGDRMRENAAVAENLRATVEAMPGAIQGSAQVAMSLADQLWRAAKGVATMLQYATVPPKGGRGADPRQFTYTDEFREQLARQDNWRAPRTGSGGGGGGRAASYDAEAEALRRLIDTQQRQIDILRETDPIQKEMLRYREMLAGASDQQRQALEELIGTRLREEEAMRGLKDQETFFRDIARDSIRGLISDAEDLGDVFDGVARSIADAALEAAIFGEGPLAGLFGGGGGGGLFGIISDALIPGHAEGGYLTGPGSGTSDSILMYGSAGEFMVNAKATAQHRPLLEAINSGSPIIGLATGGPVTPLPGPSANVGGSQQIAGTLRVQIVPGPEFDARVQSTSQNVALEVVREYDSSVLPDSVERINSDPRAIG